MSDVSTIIVVTALDFIDYSLFATGVLIAYFVFKFFAFEEEGKRASREAEVEDRRKKVWDFGKKKWGEMKEETKRKKRGEMLSAVLSFILHAEENSEKALSELRLNTPKALAEVRSLVERVGNNLYSAKRELRSVRLQARGNNELRDYLNVMIAEVESMEIELKKKVKEVLPKDPKERDYAGKINAVDASLKQIRIYCGEIHNNINDFEKKEELNHLHNFTRTP